MQGFKRLPGGKESASAGVARDLGPIPGWGRTTGGETAPRSSILAWKVPWTEETGRLQPMGPQRVGHD